jgi:hypothetical protein
VETNTIHVSPFLVANEQQIDGEKVRFETFKLKLGLASSIRSEGAYTTSTTIILFLTFV